MKVLSPTAILGYGFPAASFERGLSLRPDVIAVDAGSTDPGPHYLGAGKSFTSRKAVKRDLAHMLRAGRALGIPVLVGSAGGAGAAPHLAWSEEIVLEIAREEGLRFRMAVIPADVPAARVVEGLRRGRVTPMACAPPLTEADVTGSAHLVAQMGHEPILEALAGGAEVVLCGRAYDPAPFAAPALRAGFDPGLALHMGKILECAAIAATPGSGSDCVLATLREDCFELQALSDVRRFTALSAAAHSLYEKSDPYELPGPGGTLDLRATRYQELPGGRVRVSGTRLAPTPYAVKLEGARRIGCRAISIAGVRDPILIGQVEQVLETVRAQVVESTGTSARVLFHVYGKNGVMGPLEPRQEPAHELGIVIEAVHPEQAEADTVCSLVRSTLLHFGYPGRISTAGNLALLYSPSDISCGEVYEFSVYHLLRVDDPVELFPVRYLEVGR
ncbi:MAG: acyclic terpene utilization AtuA family protein [Deltaproteobacteria bacterium]|nr:acyclic terpene utilization AtuA family protein [Deltaproteobacteria bacterium]